MDQFALTRHRFPGRQPFRQYVVEATVTERHSRGQCTPGLSGRSVITSLTNSVFVLWIVIALGSWLHVLAGDAGAAEKARAVALLSDHLPNVDEQLVQKLVSRLEQDGIVVTRLSADQACDQQVLSADQFFLYIIPQSRTYPAAGWEALKSFAQKGGHLLFLGGPLLDDPLWQKDGRWLNRQAVRDIKSNATLTHRPFPAKSLSTDGWVRTCNDPKNEGSWKVVPAGPNGEKCFRFTTRNLNGWDGYLSPVLSALYGPGHDMLSFLAKGNDTTKQVAVEIQERDGSRWFATVEIGAPWKRICLDPSDFTYWRDSPTDNRRGGPGDHLQPAQAHRIDFQLSQSHTAAVPPGQHTFWIADIGTCVNPVAGLELNRVANDQSLESIFPRYKVFALEEPMQLTAAPQQAVVVGVEKMAAQDMICGIPRTTGLGFQRGQKWRYVPLLTATDQQNRQRGNPGWLLLNNANPYQRSVFACVGLNDVAQLSAPPMLDMISKIVQRLQTGLLLVEAGSDHFAYWPQEQARVGATVLNLGAAESSSTIRVTVRDQDGNVALSVSEQITTASGATADWQQELPLAAEPTTYRVTTQLLVDDQVVDQIEHELAVHSTATANKDEFITVQGSNFLLRGEKWYPVGINYWPLYVSGMDQDDFWAGWIPETFYDPALVEQDLKLMESLGINLVSIQAYDPKFYRNLLDFVRRCRAHRIHVNLFCGLASPIDFNEASLRGFIQEARLADNPGIVAYDTIWEPGNYMFSQQWRPRWDSDWRDWIVEQYGSIEAAEADWQFQCPRNDKGQCVSPLEQHFREDGPWRTLVAAYRRFMDDLMSRKWNVANRKLREIDPNHLISFRQGNTLPHDFAFTATPKHIDFICPEGYAISHSDDGYYVAGFISKFVHFTTKGRPIVWSEFGQSVWNGNVMEPSPERIKTVADYHELFYRMVVASGANGTVPWWWPGGYRVGEQSDFGIINPDTTPRPAAELISRYAGQLKQPRNWPAPTAWFELDCDAHAGGYWYVCFNTGREAYQRAENAKEQLGVRTAGTDTNSADTPLVAVGNRPCTGQNPPKYLNAEFNVLQILDATGSWVDAFDGSTITVTNSAPVRARVSVGNTQEALWLAPAGGAARTGDVLLVTTDESAATGSWPLPHNTACLADANFGEIELTQPITAPTRIELQMCAQDRTRFGEKRSFVLVPQAD